MCAYILEAGWGLRTWCCLTGGLPCEKNVTVWYDRKPHPLSFQIICDHWLSLHMRPLPMTKSRRTHYVGFSSQNDGFADSAFTLKLSRLPISHCWRIFFFQFPLSCILVFTLSSLVVLAVNIKLIICAVSRVRRKAQVSERHMIYGWAHAASAKLGFIMRRGPYWDCVVFNVILQCEIVIMHSYIPPDIYLNW